MSFEMNFIVDMDGDQSQSAPLLSEYEIDGVEKAIQTLNQRNWKNVREFHDLWSANRVTHTHLAACRGNVKILKRATDLEVTDKLGRSVLHYAAYQGHVEAVKWLLKISDADGKPTSSEYFARPQLSLKDSRGMMALHLAKVGGRVEVGKVLMKAHLEEVEMTILYDGENMNAKEFVRSWNLRPIHVAAILGKVEELVPTTDFAAKDGFGRCALHYAADQGHVEAVKRLLERSDTREHSAHPQLSLEDSDGMTALQLAKESRHANVVTVLARAHIEENANEFLDSWKLQPIHLDAYRGNLENLQNVRDLGATDNFDRRVLHYAADQGHVKVVEYLLQKLSTEFAGAQSEENLSQILWAQDFLGRCAMHYAADQGHVDVVKLLLEKSTVVAGGLGDPSICKLSLKDSDGMTALHLANEGRHASVVRILARAHIEEAVNNDSKNKNGEKFLEVWNVKQIHLAAYCGRFRELKSTTADSLATDNLGRYVFHYAAEQGQTDVIKYLLSPLTHIPAGKKLLKFDYYDMGFFDLFEVLRADPLGMTVFHYAAEQGHASVIAWLLNFMDITDTPRELTSSKLWLKDSDGMTALDLAMKAKQTDVTNILVRAYFEHIVKPWDSTSPHCDSAKLLSESWNVQPIHFAAFSGNLDKLKTASNFYVTDDFGRNALHYAADQGHDEAVEYLLQKLSTEVGGTQTEENLSQMLWAKDSLGRCALHYAAEQGHDSVVNLLLKQPTAVTGGLRDAAISERISAGGYRARWAWAQVRNVMKTIQHVATSSGEEKSSQLSVQDSDGMTALHLAVRARRVDVVRILVGFGANVETLNKQKLPPIFLAHCDFDRIILSREEISLYEEIIEILLLAQASVKCLHPKEDWTLLHYAVFLNSQKATQILFEHTPDLVWRSSNKTGNTPVHLAAARGSNEVLNRMLNVLPSRLIDMPNQKGFSPLHLAAIGGNFDCAQLLIHKGGNLAKLDNMGRTAISFLRQHEDYLKLGSFFTDILDACVCLNESSTAESGPKQIDEINLDFKVLAPEGKGEGKDKGEVMPQMAVISTMLEELSKEDLIVILQHPVLKAYNAMKLWHLLVAVIIRVLIQLTFAVGCSLCAISIQNNGGVPFGKVILFYLAGIRFCCSLPQIFAGTNSSPEKWTVINSIYKCCRHWKIGNWLHLFYLVIFFAIAVGIEDNADPTTCWIFYLVYTAIPLIWIQTMLLVGHVCAQFTNWGSLAFIFPVALKDLLKVFSIGILIIIGFAISFMALFRGEGEFDGFWKAVAKSVVMMTGEYDYDSLFGSDTNSSVNMTEKYEYVDLYKNGTNSTTPNLDADENAHLLMISRIVFLGFVILTSIVLMNLMIGLAVSDIQGLQNEGQFGQLLKKAEFIIDCERLARWPPVRGCRLGKYLDSNITSTRMIFTRKNRPASLSKDLVEELFNLAFKNKNCQKDSHGAIESSLAAVQSSLATMQAMLQTIVDEQKVQQSQIQVFARDRETQRQRETM